jgi:hypothetical protein
MSMLWTLRMSVPGMREGPASGLAGPGDARGVAVDGQGVLWSVLASVIAARMQAWSMMFLRSV